jgi:type VI secretion system protein ImpH
MSTSSWRKNTSVTEKLLEAPTEFKFQQAVRLLERASHFSDKQKKNTFSVNPVARFTPPSSESVRLSANTLLAFPSSEVAKIKQRDVEKHGKQWQLQVNMIGLNGAMGILPYHYTELMQKRIKQKDISMEKFFDLFNHRTTSLFYQASCKYRLPIQYERSKLHRSHAKLYDNHSNTLLSIIGMGTNGLQDRLYTKDESLIYYSGLLSQKVRTATGLKQLLRSHFEIPVEVDQFVGQWQDLIDDVRTKLPDPANPMGRNACLGRSAMLGKSGWFAQGKIRVVLGPLNRKQLQHFSPGTYSLKALHELTRLYVGLENDYEFVIRIRKRDFPEKLLLDGSNPPVMGWNTRFPSRSEYAANNDETFDISVSSRRLS